MAGLSKSRIIVHKQCPKRLWLQINRPELAAESASTAMAFSVGDQVGEVARSLFPTGILITGDDNLREAIAQTRTALSSRPRRPIFEGTFSHDGVLIRADLLFPEKRGFRMAEVKSAASVKEYHLADTAIQSWVAREAGLDVRKFEVAHIDTSFVYQGNNDYSGFFRFADVTPEIKALQKEVPGWVKAARQTLAGEEPDVEAGEQCFDPFECPFVAHCSPSAEDDEKECYPLEDLPRAAASLIESLRAEGYSDLREVPAKLLVNPKHQRIHQAVCSGRALIDPEAGRTISNMEYPRSYIDFETINFAVPIWAGTRPYSTQVPFQWSCHIEYASGKMEHHAFLATGDSDQRREFATTLLKSVGTSGPVFVYNAPFENSRIKELAELFPDLAAPLNALVDRVFDLLPLTREYYYHPAMHGSWSLKAVLPTIALDLDYSSLDVGDGSMAQDAFRELMHPETAVDRRATVRENLLAYCGQDTLALVRMCDFYMKG